MVQKLERKSRSRKAQWILLARLRVETTQLKSAVTDGKSTFKSSLADVSFWKCRKIEFPGFLFEYVGKSTLQGSLDVPFSKRWSLDE